MAVVRFNKRVKHDGEYHDAGEHITVLQEDLKRLAKMGGVIISEDEAKPIEVEVVEVPELEPVVVPNKAIPKKNKPSK